MNNSQELANLIKAIAKSQKKAIGTMLKECGLSVNTLSSMQSGGYYPRLEAVAKIADYLECSIDYLLGRTNILEEKTSNSPAETDEGVITHKIAAMGGMGEDNIRTLTKEQMNKWAELIEATRDLPPEKIDMLIKMAQSIK